MFSNSVAKDYSLFLDTHDAYLRIVLYRNKEVLTKIIKECEQSHSTITMPTIDELFKEHNITPDNLKEIYVVNGPGSFTGVRIAVTIAKTLAFTLNIPIKTITSLEVKAISSSFNGEKLVAEKDKNGSYICEFNEENKAIGEYRYLKTSEYENFILGLKTMIIDDDPFDPIAIYNYLQQEKATNAHEVKPLYIKNIDLKK